MINYKPRMTPAEFLRLNPDYINASPLMNVGDSVTAIDEAGFWTKRIIAELVDIVWDYGYFAGEPLKFARLEHKMPSERPSMS